MRIGTIMPMPPAAQHALAATWALQRAGDLLFPIGIPEQMPPPDIPGARLELQDAIEQLEQAVQAAGARPGRLTLEAALHDARTGLALLDRPGINPPLPAVLEHAMRGADLARDAIGQLEHEDFVPLPGPHIAA